MTKARCSKAPLPATSASSTRGRARCAPSTATMLVSWTPISAPTPASISPATAAGAMLMATTGSLVAHPKVAESAVVGYPHPIKGQGIYAYVSLMAGEQPTDALKTELVQWVRKEIGPIASPDVIQFAPGLPKTRSGKIMRRILRKIAENDFANLGDTSTLADPAVV